MDLLKGDKSPSSDTLLPVDAREKTAPSTQTSLDSQQTPAPASKMAFARRTVMVVLLCLLVLLGFASAGSSPFPCHKGTPDSQPADGTSTSPSSLHDLLHRYLPGKFRADRQAIEAARQADEHLATSTLQLAKRDTNSTTVSVSPTPTTETTTSATSPPDSSSSSTAVSTTSSSTITSSSTSSAPPPPPSTTTTSHSATPTPPGSSSLPGTSSSLSETIPSSTSSLGPTTTSSSSGSHTLSSSSLSSETTLTTSTVPPTTTRSSRSSTSKQIIETLTSTHSDGAVVIITATTYVPAGDEPTSTSKRPAPTLQNAAIQHRGSGAVLAGALGPAMLLLVL